MFVIFFTEHYALDYSKAKAEKGIFQTSHKNMWLTVTYCVSLLVAFFYLLVFRHLFSLILNVAFPLPWNGMGVQL